MRKGFTLLELIVVVTIIGILGSIVVVKVVPYLTTTRQTVARHDMRTIVETAKMIFTQSGSWPESIEEMVHDDPERIGLPPPVPVDPWGQPYIYELTEGGPLVRTLGRDQREGGSGEDEDLVWPAGRDER
jgi:general secretion pathway protein G